MNFDVSGDVGNFDVSGDVGNFDVSGDVVLLTDTISIIISLHI